MYFSDEYPFDKFHSFFLCQNNVSKSFSRYPSISKSIFYCKYSQWKMKVCSKKSTKSQRVGLVSRVYFDEFTSNVVHSADVPRFSCLWICYPLFLIILCYIRISKTFISCRTQLQEQKSSLLCTLSKPLKLVTYRWRKWGL